MKQQKGQFREFVTCLEACYSLFQSTLQLHSQQMPAAFFPLLSGLEVESVLFNRHNT
jgi:hypothetical protein